MKVTIPTEWKEVSLETIQAYNKAIKHAESDLDKCVTLVSIFCQITTNKVLRMPISDLMSVANEITNLLNKPFTKKFESVLEIDGQKYGFVNLQKITTGEWVDLETIISANKDDIQACLHELMNILYRPIIKETKRGYKIKPYDGEGDADKFLKIDIDTVQGMSSFFLLLGLRLQTIILESIQKENQAEKHLVTKAQDGKGRSLNWQIGNLTTWKRLFKRTSKRH